jgi:hypothetical protein
MYPVHLLLEEVTVHASFKILIVFDLHFAVCNPLGIFKTAAQTSQTNLHLAVGNRTLVIIFASLNNQPTLRPVSFFHFFI